MAIIRNNWQNLNANRSFPLTEECSKLDDAGLMLPDDWLSTCRVTFIGGSSYRLGISAIYSGPAMVSLVLSAFDSSNPSVKQAIGAVTAARPIVAGRPYTVTPLVTGTAGWVCFGGGVTTAPSTGTSYRFSNPDNAQMLLTQAWPTTTNQFKYVSKTGLSTKLTGLVKLRGENGLYISAGLRTIDGQSVRCIVFGLDTSESIEVLSNYAGPCSGVPESGTCDFTPISHINGVPPDASGNITIEADSPFVILARDNGASLLLPPEISLTNICSQIKQTPDSSDITGTDSCG